ncbi:MAG TPA: hypothetical protein VK206_24655 [Anaerolineales bacterium]|nr:hypothetical protein [Anaerolineales bacterium]
MFGELPKLFDRNFVIGFFLPVAIFVIFSLLIVSPYAFGALAIDFLKTDLLAGTTAIGLGLFAWVGGIILLAINRDLYRFMEGYGKYNPLKLLRVFGWMEKRRYRKAVKELEKLDDEYRECIRLHQKFPVESNTKRNEVMRQLAEEFPDEEKHLLPTPFGNVLRSFEIYPRVMYGFEAIDGWGRVLAVIPKDYLELIDAARAQVDFWVNLGVVFILLQIEYISLAFITWTPMKEWVVLLFIALGTLAPLRATSSAREWGDFVKSAFDIYRFDLLESLGIDIPKTREEERELWTEYSQAIIYRLPETLPALKNSANKPASKKATSK